MRETRQAIPSEFVHVTMRGLGRRSIFEDDADRRRFLTTLAAKSGEADADVYAWCLMQDHVHLLIRADDSSKLSKLMHRLGVSYAQYYNGRHGHVGKVFQSRFGSQPICEDAHLLAAIRYIHRNALDTGVADLSKYAWSSYRELSGGGMPCEGAGIVNVSSTLGLFGGRNGFVEFHNRANEVDEYVRIDGYRPRLDDAEAKDIATRLFGSSFADRICAMQKKERDDALASLKDHGLSVRQIERLTGIGRGIISRA